MTVGIHIENPTLKSAKAAGIESLAGPVLVGAALSLSRNGFVMSLTVYDTGEIECGLADTSDDVPFSLLQVSCKDDAESSVEAASTLLTASLNHRAGAKGGEIMDGTAFRPDVRPFHQRAEAAR